MAGFGAMGHRPLCWHRPDFLRRRVDRARARFAWELTEQIELTTWSWSGAVLVTSHHDRAAGDVEDDAGHPRRVVGGEIKRGERHVVRRAKPADRMQFAQRILLRHWDTFFVALGEDRFWRYAICPNAIRTNLCGEVLRENF